MYCPMKFSKACDSDGILGNASPQCETTNCSWWNERFGMCCIAVKAYQLGIEDRRKEFRDR